MSTHGDKINMDLKWLFSSTYNIPHFELKLEVSLYYANDNLALSDIFLL
jgi:hypothetical protein